MKDPAGVIHPKEGHPAQGVVGQDGALEEGGIGEEVVGLVVGQAYLVFGLLDPGLGGGALTVGAMGLPGAERFAVDVAEGVIGRRHRQEFRLRRGGGGFAGTADHQEEAQARPALGLMGELALLPARLVAHRRPVLLGQEGFQVSQLDLNVVAMVALIQVLQQGSIEEAAVGAEYQTLLGRKLGDNLCHEGNDAIAGIGTPVRSQA